MSAVLGFSLARASSTRACNQSGDMLRQSFSFLERGIPPHPMMASASLTNFACFSRLSMAPMSSKLSRNSRKRRAVAR